MRKFYEYSGMVRFKKIFVLLVLSACFFFAAEMAWAEKNQKIVVIDLAGVLKGYKKAEKYSLQLKKEIQEKQKEINKSKTEVGKLRESFAKEVAALSEKERGKKQKILEDKLNSLQRLVSSANQGLKEMDKDMQKKIYAEVNQVIKTVAQRKDYDLVIQSQGVVFYNRGFDDITEAVIQELNKKAK